jgi:negative regulator of sigma-B (phosphoserine phosphatase)
MIAPERINKLIDWGVASRGLESQAESGDSHLVQSFPNGLLIAVVDGLGHGREAAVAAKKAVETLAAFAHESPLSLMNRCHKNLADTRGAVISLASFNPMKQTMTWMGVGSVETVLLRADPQDPPASETLLLYSGVLGYQLPPLRAATIAVKPGDTLILATDGIQSGFSEMLPRKDSAQKIADYIMARYGKSTDDALVLVARYLGLMP